MTGTALVTDSTCYLPPGQASALGISVVPLHVVVDGRSYDEPDVDLAALYRSLAAGGEPPTTSQPSPGEFLAAFEGAAAGGAERVLCVTCSAALSGTHRSAELAAGMAALPVDVVDSGTVSGGLLLVVGELARSLQAGASHDELLAQARSLTSRVRSTWSSGAAATLQAGGRLTGEAPAGAAVYALDGGIVVLGEARSPQEAVDLQAERIRAAAAQSPTRVSVGHGDVPELADALERALADAPGVLGIDRYVVGPVVGAHAGPDNVGASWLAPTPDSTEA